MLSVCPSMRIFRSRNCFRKSASLRGAPGQSTDFRLIEFEQDVAERHHATAVDLRRFEVGEPCAAARPLALRLRAGGARERRLVLEPAAACSALRGLVRERRPGPATRRRSASPARPAFAQGRRHLRRDGGGLRGDGRLLALASASARAACASTVRMSARARSRSTSTVLMAVSSVFAAASAIAVCARRVAT